MLYLPPGTTPVLLEMATQRAFHLEVEDDHAVANEDEPMRRWRAGLPPLAPDNYPPDWKRWADLCVATTARGIAMQRVRVVTEPHTDYIRFLHAVTGGHNVAHGEDVRWLPRHHTDPTELTADEWWLLDDNVLAWTLFDPQGDFAGFAVTHDQVEVARAVTIRDTLWSKAIQHDEYTSESR
ncbi:DUF6879 family protein [Nocardia sp. XZ_19_369]|uniref:DUF6879 family protein n=1 Tax=Nocardia sp. XZ_19_369 TaxID=2769487 RepID=UPI00188FD4A9|nr:DUF6879 family protein [Nocardia sp. XZ_19_369]